MTETLIPQLVATSPDGKFEIKIGKVKDNTLNLVSNFDTTKYVQLITFLNDHPFVKKVVSIFNYADSFGGYTLYVYDNYDYEIFMNDLVEIMEITLV